MKKIAVFLCTLMLLLPLSGCSSGQEQRFSSPSGAIEIVVKYDFVSRPTVYRECGLFDRVIWNYTGSGFMETVYFQPEWISETEFIFRYDDHRGDQWDEEFLISVED